MIRDLHLISSSNIKSAKYNTENGDRYIIFHNGGWPVQYVFREVPNEVIEEWEAEKVSAGTFFNENIKWNFEYLPLDRIRRRGVNASKLTSADPKKGLSRGWGARDIANQYAKTAHRTRGWGHLSKKR